MSSVAGVLLLLVQPRRSRVAKIRLVGGRNKGRERPQSRGMKTLAWGGMTRWLQADPTSITVWGSTELDRENRREKTTVKIVVYARKRRRASSASLREGPCHPSNTLNKLLNSLPDSFFFLPSIATRDFIPNLIEFQRRRYTTLL